MPHTEAVLRAAKPEVERELSGLGGMIKRRRRERGLKQTEAGALMGVSEFSVVKWEKGLQPSDRWYPAIIAFLGFEPWPIPQTLGEALQAERRRRGLSIDGAALLLGVDEGTWGRWERGDWRPMSALRGLIDEFVGFAVRDRFPNDVR